MIRWAHVLFLALLVFPATSALAKTPIPTPKPTLNAGAQCRAAAAVAIVA